MRSETFNGMKKTRVAPFAAIGILATFGMAWSGNEGSTKIGEQAAEPKTAATATEDPMSPLRLNELDGSDARTVNDRSSFSIRTKDGLHLALPANPRIDSDHPEYYDGLAEALRTIPREVWQSQGIDPAMLTPAMLRAADMEDAGARKEALKAAVSSLPEEQRRLFEGGFQTFDPASTRKSELSRVARMSIADAYKLLSEHQQQALQDYKHLIDDELAFMKTAGQSKSKEAMSAVFKLESLRFPDPTREKTIADLQRRAAAAEARGFHLSNKQVPRPEMMLSKIRQQRLMKKRAGLTAPALSEDKTIGSTWAFRTIAEFEQQSGTLAAPLPSYVVAAGVEGFIGPWKGGVARVFSNSSFEAALMVLQYPADTVIFPAANLSIAGREASVKTIRYADGGWSTQVMAFDGNRVFIIEVAARLEGALFDDFVRFARDVVENG